jgi:predicted nucleotidyltransferase
MTRETALALLNEHRDELAAFGLRRLAVFGSVARNEARPDSDVDVLVEFEGKPTFNRYAGLYDCLEDLLERPVDLVTVSAVRPFMRGDVEEDALEIW